MSYEYSALELKLRAECELGFKVGGRSDVAVSPTGETFTELINPGRKLANTKAEVYRMALDTFRKYAGRKGTIYWRVWPEILGDKKGWKFYMRVLVSDKLRIKIGKGIATTARSRRTVNAVL